MIIIWQRWGILAVLFLPLGVGIGFLLSAVVGIPATSGSLVGAFIGVGMVISAVIMWFVVRATVGKVIDKPRPAVITQQLAEPVVDPDGTRRTHRQVPITDPETGGQL